MAKSTTLSALPKVNWPREARQVSTLSLEHFVTALTLNGIPLHGVLVGDLTKLPFDDGGKRVVVEVVVIDLCTEVDLALGANLGIKTSSSVTTTVGRRLLRLGRSRVATTRARNTLVVVVVDLLTLQARLASLGTIPINTAT